MSTSSTSSSSSSSSDARSLSDHSSTPLKIDNLRYSTLFPPEEAQAFKDLFGDSSGQLPTPRTGAAFVSSYSPRNGYHGVIPLDRLRASAELLLQNLDQSPSTPETENRVRCLIDLIGQLAALRQSGSSDVLLSSSPRPSNEQPQQRQNDVHSASQSTIATASQPEASSSVDVRANVVSNSNSSSSSSSDDSSRKEEGFQCLICWDVMPESQKRVLPACGHSACASCLDGHLKSLVFSGRVRDEELICFAQDCKAIISEDTVERFVLDRHTYEKYMEFKLVSELQINGNALWCPNKRCSASVIAVDDEVKQTCRSCQLEFCRNCRRPWHEGQTCETSMAASNSPEDQEEREFEKWKVSAEVKECPKCGIPTEKLPQGCSHFTCTACRHQYCWLCRQPYTQEHYAIPDTPCYKKQFLLDDGSPDPDAPFFDPLAGTFEGEAGLSLEDWRRENRNRRLKDCCGVLCVIIIGLIFLPCVLCYLIFQCCKACRS